MENQSNNKSVVTPWSFRDGREYIVSVSVNEKPKSIGILISDKITAEEWSCHYDLKCKCSFYCPHLISRYCRDSD